MDERERALVVELFERRAGGANGGELTRFLQGEGVDVTKSGVRSILKNRCYVGEMRVQNGRKGHPTIIKDHHAPILTEQQWEAAQVKHAFYPRTGVSQDASLRGLVYCKTCGRRCKISLYGPPANRKPTYTCTYEKCTAHAGIAAMVRSCTGVASRSRSSPTSRHRHNPFRIEEEPVPHQIVDASEIEAVNGVFKPLRHSLGVTAFGINQLELPPDAEGPEHDHGEDGQEEVYAIVRGGGTIRVEGEERDLNPGQFVFLAPGTPRQMVAGPDGLAWIGIGCQPGAYRTPQAE